MNRHRFHERATVTNYEMAGLRSEQAHRNTSWGFVWASVSKSFHPRSVEDWEQHMKGNQ